MKNKKLQKEWVLHGPRKARRISRLYRRGQPEGFVFAHRPAPDHALPPGLRLSRDSACLYCSPVTELSRVSERLPRIQTRSYFILNSQSLFNQVEDTNNCIGNGQERDTCRGPSASRASATLRRVCSIITLGDSVLVRHGTAWLCSPPAAPGLSWGGWWRDGNRNGGPTPSRHRGKRR